MCWRIVFNFLKLNYYIYFKKEKNDGQCTKDDGKDNRKKKYVNLNIYFHQNHQMAKRLWIQDKLLCKISQVARKQTRTLIDIKF